jgi:hypothetical protein
VLPTAHGTLAGRHAVSRTEVNTLLKYALISGATFAVCAALAIPAAAAERTVGIISKTGNAITELYGSNNGTDILTGRYRHLQRW